MSQASKTEIIKTWPAFMEPALVRRVFDGKWRQYYFTLGRGRPQSELGRIWFTHRGVLLGSFVVAGIVVNDGSLPKLTRLDGGPSEWQIKPDRWVAVCVGPIDWLGEQVFHESFRGWRYFDFETYRNSLDARLNLEVYHAV